KHEPDQIANHAERAGPDIRLAGDFVAAERLRAEWQQGIDGDIERRTRPWEADNRDGHDDGGDQPAKGHPGAADQDPEDVEEDGHRLHAMTRRAALLRLLIDPRR